MTSNLTFIYDGECPFCNHFAELLEVKSKLKNISIVDGRKNPILINSLLEKGYDIDKGAILQVGEDIFHGYEKQLNQGFYSNKHRTSSVIRSC